MWRVRERRVRVLAMLRRAENADVASVAHAPVLTLVAHPCHFCLSRIYCKERCCHWLPGRSSTSLVTLQRRLISPSSPVSYFKTVLKQVSRALPNMLPPVHLPQINAAIMCGCVCMCMSVRVCVQECAHLCVLKRI